MIPKIKEFFIFIFSSAIVLAPWLFASCVIVYSKYQDMRFTGYRVAERALGRDKIVVSGDSFSLYEMLSFYVSDVMIVAFLVPALLLTLCLVMKKSHVLLISFLMSLFAIMLFFIQSQSISIVGAPTSYSMIIDSFGFAKSDPSIIMDYFSLSALCKLGFALIVLIVTYFISQKFIDVKCLNASVVYVCLSIICFFSLVWTVGSVPNTKYHDSLLLTNVSIFLGLSDRKVFTMDEPTDKELKRFFLGLTGGDDIGAVKSDSFGAHKGSDLIVFILETAPVKVMDVSVDNADLSRTRELFDGAIYSNKHYSTFPYSNLAIYSILTSFYPTGEIIDFIERGDVVVPSFITKLQEKGYSSTYFLPCSNTFKFDRIMYKSAGLGDEYLACEEDSYKNATFDNAVDKKLTADMLAFDAMKDRIKAHHKADTRYAHVIAPQIGHAPWVSLNGEVSHQDRGRAIVAKQNEVIGSIVDLLKEAGKLDDTVIVITSDHGIRTKKEDPAFPGNVVDEYSFNVPLLIYAPKAKKLGRLSNLTSHVDILPSIMDVMGVEYPKENVQGRSVFSAPVERKIYFNADYYLGADGFYEKGVFYSVNHSTGEVFMNESALDFKSSIHLAGSDKAGFINGVINDFYSFQNYWQTYHLRDHK